MQPIPKDILTDFDEMMKQRRVPALHQPDYRKWMRYFLDFRSKYRLSDSKAEQVRLFVEKLRSKNQTKKQQEQAADAVSLLFALQTKKTAALTEHSVLSVASPLNAAQGCDSPVIPRHAVVLRNQQNMICDPPASSGMVPPPRRRGGKQYDEWRCLRKTDSPEWDKVIADLADEIKIRHYSRKTLKHYADWGRKFQSFLKSKPPAELSSSDVKTYLTYLAVNCKVSSSHQNQAFNAHII